MSDTTIQNHINGVHTLETSEENQKLMGRIMELVNQSTFNEKETKECLKKLESYDDPPSDHLKNMLIGRLHSILEKKTTKTTTNTINTITGKEILNKFKTLCTIPRPSKTYEPFIQYISGWALGRNDVKEIEVDSSHNVLIRLAGRGKYRHCDPICIQGHYDMVPEATEDYMHEKLRETYRKKCEKGNMGYVESSFSYDSFAEEDGSTTHVLLVDGEKKLELNYKRDIAPVTPIEIDEEKLKQGIVQAKGTTLGFDDGEAIAAAMAAADLEDRPPLAILIPSNEEIGCQGAKEFDTSKIANMNLINIDNPDGVLYVDQASRDDFHHHQDIDFEERELASDEEIYEIELTTIGDASGGGSIVNAGWEQDYLNKGNSILLLLDVIRKVKEKYPGYQCDVMNIDGGGEQYYGYIPQKTKMQVIIKSGQKKAVKEAIEREMKRSEFYTTKTPKDTRNENKITITKWGRNDQVRYMKNFDELATNIARLRSGNADELTPEGSCAKWFYHLGRIFVDPKNNKLISGLTFRAFHDGGSEAFRKIFEKTGAGGDLQERAFPQGYPREKRTPYKRLYDDSMPELLDAWIQGSGGHQKKRGNLIGGLEAGIFHGKDGIQALSIGAYHTGLHTPAEQVTVTEIDRLAKGLQAILVAHGEATLPSS